MIEAREHRRNLLNRRTLVAGSLAAGIALSLTACGDPAPDIHGTVVSRQYVPERTKTYNKRIVTSTTCEDEGNDLLGDRSGAHTHAATGEESDGTGEENDTTTTTSQAKHTSEPVPEDCVTHYGSTPTTTTTPPRYTLTVNECDDNGQNCSLITTPSLSSVVYDKYPIGSYYPASESPAPTPSPSSVVTTP